MNNQTPVRSNVVVLKQHLNLIPLGMVNRHAREPPPFPLPTVRVPALPTAFTPKTDSPLVDSAPGA